LHAHDCYQNVTRTSGHRIWHKKVQTHALHALKNCEFSEEVQHGVLHTGSTSCARQDTRTTWCSLHRDGMNRWSTFAIFFNCTSPHHWVTSLEHGTAASPHRQALHAGTHTTGTSGVVLPLAICEHNFVELRSSVVYMYMDTVLMVRVFNSTRLWIVFELTHNATIHKIWASSIQQQRSQQQGYQHIGFVEDTRGGKLHECCIEDCIIVQSPLI